MSSYLNKIGFKNTWVDARDIVKTDNTYRNAKIDWNAYISKMLLAPSNAPSSMTSIRFRLRSRLSNCGSRLNNPKAGTRLILLSFKRSRFAVFGRSRGNSVKSLWAQSTVPPSQ